MLRSTLVHASRWLIATVLAISGMWLLAQAAPADFSVVMLPDTQFYSETYPATFSQQTQWVVNHRTAWNIRFVIGEGDIVNTPGNSYEWVNADAAIKILDKAGIPYVLAVGNHDYDGVKPTTRSTVAYNHWFGVSRYSRYPWYGGHSGTTNENFYGSFTVNGQRYLVIALEYYPRDAALAWAESVMGANPGAKVFITTHSFVFTDGTRGDICDTNDMKNTTGRNAETAWEQVLRKQPNLQLVVSGHLVSTNSAHRSDLGDNGNLVNQVFTNFQNWTRGGNGYFRIFKFRPALNVIEVYTYSPSLNKFLTDSLNQFKLKITNDGNTATSGAISGKVRTTSCTVIPGAHVTAGASTTTTDANGRFTISKLNGQVTVSVKASGYTVPSQTTTVFNGFTTQTDFYPTGSGSGGGGTAGVKMTSPVDGSIVSNPVPVKATATSSVAISYMQLYVDGVKVLEVNGNTMTTTAAMGVGAHRVAVQAKDADGVLLKQTVNVTVK